MYLRIHDKKDGKIIAVCDKELIGKILEEGDKCINLNQYQDFYKGELSDINTISNALKNNFNSANLVGENAVNVALNIGLVEKNEIMYINTTPYIQIYKI